MPLRAARISAAPWVDRLRAAIAGVREGEDPEAVHRLRVALGHLQVWLNMAGHSTLRGSLRTLRRAASPLRDLDVRLAQQPSQAEVKRLAAQRRALAQPLLMALDAAQPALEIVAGLPAASADVVLAWAQVFAARVRLAGKRWRPRRGIDATHRFRRHVRRLRYALEFLERPSQGVAALQASLGTVCDCALALREVEHSHRRDRRRLMARQHEAAQLARTQWKALRPWLDRVAKGKTLTAEGAAAVGARR